MVRRVGACKQGLAEAGWSTHKPAPSGMRQPEAAAGGGESAGVGVQGGWGEPVSKGLV